MTHLKTYIKNVPRELGKQKRALAQLSAPTSPLWTAFLCSEPGKNGTHLMKAQVVLHSRGDVEDVPISGHSDDKSIECLKTEVEPRVILPSFNPATERLTSPSVSSALGDREKPSSSTTNPTKKGKHLVTIQ